MAKDRTNGQAATKDPPAATLTDVLGVLARATPEDLATLDAQIAAKEAEIDQLLAGHRGELDGLKQLRQVLAKRLGLEQPKKKWTRRQPKAVASGGSPAARPTEPGVADDEDSVARRKRIAVLLNVRQPLALATIAKEIDAHHITVLHLLNANRGYFQKGPDELYRLTQAGKRDLVGAA